MINKFTKEDIKKLENNKNVLKVSEHSISYNYEFKVLFITLVITEPETPPRPAAEAESVAKFVVSLEVPETVVPVLLDNFEPEISALTLSSNTFVIAWTLAATLKPPALAEVAPPSKSVVWPAVTLTVPPVTGVLKYQNLHYYL